MFCFLLLRNEFDFYSLYLTLIFLNTMSNIKRPLYIIKCPSQVCSNYFKTLQTMLLFVFKTYANDLLLMFKKNIPSRCAN